MFNEEKFAIFVLACIVIGIVIKILYQKWGHKLPERAYTKFSFQEIFSYYKSAIKIIVRKKWLLWFPLCLVLFNNVFAIPTLISQRAYMASEKISLENFNYPCKDLSFSECLDKIREPLLDKFSDAALNTMASLDYAYADVFTSNFLFIILFLIGATIVVFRKPSNKFLFGLQNYNPENYSFLVKIFKLSLAVVLFFFAQIIIFNFMKFETPSTSFFEYPGLFIISLLSMSLLSLVQGMIFFAIYMLSENKLFTYKELLYNAMDIAKPLFYLNIILSLVASIPNLLMLPCILQTCDSNLTLPYFSFARSNIFILINTLFAVLTYCSTFVLIVQGGTLRSAFLFNFKFIANHLFKYIQFVFVAGLLMFLPALVSIIVWFFIVPLSFTSIFINILTSLMEILIAVPVFTAFFLFFKDNYQMESSADIVLN